MKGVNGTVRDDLKSDLQGGAAAAPLSLDDLFRRTLARQPDAVALIDPPNKLQISGERPQRFTYAQADCAISAIASRFQEASLPPGSIIALQLPNTIEFPIALLAAIRAGLVVALLPQLWRQSDLAAALNKLSARAIVGMEHIEIVDHGDIAMNAAAEAFSVRHVFGFGKNLPDGMTRLTIDANDTHVPPMQTPFDPQRPAIVSFDVTADGMCAVPRNHSHLIAGGLAVTLESALPTGAKILSTIAPASFGGMATSIVPWLLSGGSLSLYHAGALHVFERDMVAGQQHDVLIAPALLALRLANSGAFAEASSISHVIGLWRAPERMASSDDWPTSAARLTDVCVFGEIGLVSATRLDDGSAAPIKSGLQLAPRAIPGSRIVGELSITSKGTLAMKGAMVPLAAYRSATATGAFDAAADRADTGYAAKIDKRSGAIDIASPPAGLFAVGGYRFLAEDLDQWSQRLGVGVTLAALPDQLNGHRLAGRATDARRVREVLGELGLNPLMVDAFRERAKS